MVLTKKLHNLVPLGFILALAFFLKLPSIFEPSHYGDEGIYQVIGQAMRRGAILYLDIWDNKPPLLYLFYSTFDGDQFSLRLLSLIFALLAIVAFYFLAQEIFLKRLRIIFLTTLIFAVFISLPLLEGNIANAENFMFLPIILAFLVVFKNSIKLKTSHLLVSGFLLGLAFLFKIVAVFDFGALFLFLLILFWEKRKKQVRADFLLALSFVLPLALTTVFFLSQGVFREFLSASFSQNVSYVAWGNKFLIAQGWLVFKLFLLGLFCLFLFWKRKELERGQLLIFLWLGFSLFNAFFAQRPWTHYLLVLVPPISLLLGILFATAKFRTLTFIIIILTTYLGVTKFWLYGKTVDYYLNFFSFVAGKKTLSDYYSFWDGHVNRDYRVAQFLKLKTASFEPVFIWGNNAQIYALAKRPPASRYTVAYHMSFTPSAEEEVARSLVRKRPRYFIVLQPQTDPLGRIQTVLSHRYQSLFQEDGFTVYERRP